MKILVPKTYVERKNLLTPLFFLAGPIKGGGNWQTRCIGFMAQRSLRFTVAIPFQLKEDNPYYCWRETGKEDYFERRLHWERYYLELAQCIIFWLPCENKTDPRNDGQPYARDTYGELGEWRGRLIGNRQSKRIVIGAEPGFPGIDVITANFKAALGQEFPIYGTLEETVDAAMYP